MKPQPLSKKRLDIIRSEIKEARTNPGLELEYIARLEYFVQGLLSAEQFWREALKKVSPYDEYEYCAFCEEWKHKPHKPDCPWLLAQE